MGKEMLLQLKEAEKAVRLFNTDAAKLWEERIKPIVLSDDYELGADGIRALLKLWQRVNVLAKTVERVKAHLDLDGEII